jgi:hypothetical protein
VMFCHASISGTSGFCIAIESIESRIVLFGSNLVILLPQKACKAAKLEPERGSAGIIACPDTEVVSTETSRRFRPTLS